MENNQPEKLDKKSFIKKAIVSILGSIAFGLLLVFIAYGQIPFKPILIAITICIVVMSISFFFAFKYPNRISPANFRKIFLILGILIVIFNLGLIMIEGGKINYYLSIILGLYFISGPNLSKPKREKSIEN